MLIANIKHERQKQLKKWGKQQHPLFVWALILFEEVGECCEAWLDLISARQKDSTVIAEISRLENDRYCEFIQVLTVLFVAFPAEWRPWHGVFAPWLRKKSE